MKFDAAPFKARRQRLLAQMLAAGGGVAVLPSGGEKIRNRDTYFPYRADSYFWYLSGFPEPEAAIVLVADGKSGACQELLFCRDKNEEREIWEGYRFGPGVGGERFGFDAAYVIDELDARVANLLENQPALYFALGADAGWDTRMTTWLAAVRAQTRAGKSAPATVHDLRTPLDAMRRIKDAHEIALLQRAADIAGRAHERAMRNCRPGMHEYELEAEFLHEFRRAGSQAPSYPAIIAGGRNACVLHYTGNDQPLADGDLVLIDAGCEIDGYASDITRTFPINGRFSAAQRDVYDIVLTAQLAAIEAVRPGQNFLAPHEAAVRVLAQGLVDLKLLSGSVDSVIESESYKRFYMHRTSHWLGLDVHDAGEYRAGEAWAPLEAGMVLTVEPGLYLRAADDVPAALRDIGVRIEDDVLVTEQGANVLTSPAKRVSDIEVAMRG
jgi:Xaa-Pro aminopeptidase